MIGTGHEQRVRHDIRLVPAALVAWMSVLAGLRVTWWLTLGAGVLTVALAVVLLVKGRSTATLLWPLVVVGLCVSGPLTARLYANAHDPLKVAAESGAVAVLRVELIDRARPVRTEGFANQRGNSRLVAIKAEVIDAHADGVGVGSTGRVLLLAPSQGWAAALPGQEVTAVGRLAPATRADFVAATLRVRGVPAGLSPAPWWQRAADSARRDLRVVSAGVLDADEAGLLPGLVVGDTSAMPRRVEAEFLDAGMSHLVAVSGSNVAIVCGAVLVVARGLRLGPRASAAVAGVALVGFVILVGYEPSVLRASVMGAVGLLALWLGRVRSALPALAAAVILLVLYDPGLAVSVGFALSVIATAALVLLAPGWAAMLRARGVPPGFAEGLAVPMAAFVSTAPIIAAMSGQISLITVAANVLAAPVIAPVTVLGVLAAVTAGFAPGVAGVFVRLAGPEASWLVWVAREASGVPSAVVGWPGGWWGGILLAVLAAAFVFVFRYRRFRVGLAAVVVGVLLVVVPMRVVAPGWPPPAWSFAACDVGQGDGLVLSTGEQGRAVVVDTGTELGTIDRCLDRLDIDRVPLLVLSHLHADHVGGLAAVLDGRSVGAVAVGPGHAPRWAWREVAEVSDRFAVPLVQLAVGERFHWPALDIRVLGPRYVPRSEVDEPDGTLVNNGSVVLMATTRAGRVLLTGDVELAAQADLLASGEDLRAEVLKVPHHGSRASLPAFLDAVAPSIAVISVGAGNLYGHPNRQVVDSLSRSGALILRTDVDGLGVVASDARGPFIVRAARGPPSGPQPASALRTASTFGGTVALGPILSSTASSVLSPSPVMSRTVSASGSILPASMSFLAVATVTPPAVSAKMPSVRASSRMPSTTSSSVTSSIAPPVRLTTSSTYGPSAGLPIASDRAMVFGLTGWTTS